MSKPELVIVDTLRDKHGRTVRVGWRGSDVEIIVTPHSGHDGRIALDAGQRDRFIKAWAEAGRQAEAVTGAAAVITGGGSVQDAVYRLYGLPATF